MTKLYKAEIYILDLNDSFSDLKEIVNTIENNTHILVNCFDEKVAEIDWDDDLDINKTNCSVENYREYFD